MATLQFPSLPLGSFIKPMKPCLASEGQQRADNTSKTAVRSTRQSLTPWSAPLRVYASHRHVIQCAGSTRHNRRTRCINSRQDNKIDMPDIALWSSSPLIPHTSLCRLLTLHVFQAYICVFFPSWSASWCKPLITMSA
jgi:hypothetical protein